jgi:hypothetical protein
MTNLELEVMAKLYPIDRHDNPVSTNPYIIPCTTSIGNPKELATSSTVNPNPSNRGTAV